MQWHLYCHLIRLTSELKNIMFWQWRKRQTGLGDYFFMNEIFYFVLFKLQWIVDHLNIKLCKISVKIVLILKTYVNWTASSEFGTYRLCEQRRFRRACASAQSRQNLRCSLIQTVSQEEPSDRKLDPWPLWMAGHEQLKFVMTECSKTQIRLTGLNYQRSALTPKITDAGFPGQYAAFARKYKFC